MLPDVYVVLHADNREAVKKNWLPFYSVNIFPMLCKAYMYMHSTYHELTVLYLYVVYLQIKVSRYVYGFCGAQRVRVPRKCCVQLNPTLLCIYD